MNIHRQSLRNKAKRLGRKLGLSTSLLLVSWCCQAQTTLAVSVEALAQFRQSLQAHAIAELDEEVRRSLQRVDVELGELDTRLRLAPCQQVEPALSAGSRLWGKTTVGMKCSRGANWTVLLPAQIKMTGEAWVLNKNANAGEALSAQDLGIKPYEWTQFAPNQLLVPGQIAQLSRKVLARPVTTGQLLRDDMLRAPLAVTTGDVVRVVVEGNGFAVSMDARAVSSGLNGQVVRVQTDNGKMLSGVAQAGKTVAIRF